MSSTSHRQSVRPAFLLRALLAILALGYLIACIGLYAMQEEMIFVGAGRLPDLPPAPQGWETHAIDHDEGQGVAWFYRQPGTGPAVIMMHGNGETIAGWPVAARPWIERGYSVLLPELRGYGGTDGSPNAARVGSDMRAWRAWLDEQPETAGPIAYHGFSLGGGVVGQLAATHPPDLLVLQSTFTDITSLAPLPVPSFLVENEFDTRSVLQRIDVPTVVVHGERDEVIPVEHGESLAQTAGVDLIRYDGGHAGPRGEASARMWKAIDGAAGHD